jgi:hypothetical protein
MPKDPDPTDPTDLADRAAAAEFLSAISADLAILARRHGFDTLGYLLEMARLEAEQVGRTYCGGY